MFTRRLYLHRPMSKSIDFICTRKTWKGMFCNPFWFRTPEEVEAVFGPGSYPVHQVGRFRYHWHRIATFWFYLRKGLALCRKGRYDCIVAYSHMTTGVCAGLKLFSGNKLIIEIATTPNLIYLTEQQHPNWKQRWMHGIQMRACICRCC
jgi:hypothetical protein